jgi:hypothetical protein
LHEANESGLKQKIMAYRNTVYTWTYHQPSVKRTLQDTGCAELSGKIANYWTVANRTNLKPG